MTTPIVHGRLVGTPLRVRLEREEGVDDDFWYALAVRLVARQTPDMSMSLDVPLERLLQGRLWLRDHCLNYGIGLDLDAAITERLTRAHKEAVFLDAVLSGTAAARTAAAEDATATRFTRELRPFQKRDLAKVLSLEHGANFSVPGAGKTAVTYALYENERRRGRVDRLLAVAPLSAFEAWEDEAQRCFDTPPNVRRFDGQIAWDAEVLLINYQRLKEPYFEEIASWALEGRAHVVLDEAHRMKRGELGEWGRACLALAHVAERRDILTGTPAPHSPQDFVALLDFLWPNQARRILPATALHPEPPPGAIELVSEALEPLFVRTTKSELGLRAPKLHVELVPLEGLQLGIYDALRNRYAGMFDLSRADRTLLAQMGEVTMYLLEAATNPALLTGRTPDQGAIPFRYPSLAVPVGADLAVLVASYHRHEIPLKFKKLATIVEENARAGRKTLVWSNFVGNLLALERLLARHKPALVYGGIPIMETAPPGVRTRETELSRFRSDADCFVLLANPAAIGEGISLHEVCHDAIYVERTFNAGQYLQSVDRIHRLGLPPDVETNVTFLLTTGTIDEQVDQRVAAKATRLSAMLDDPDLVTMALPDEDEYGEAIEDLADLEALFAHLSGNE